MTDDEPPAIDPDTGLPIGPPVLATPATFPTPVELSGRYVRLEPLSPAHARDLYHASSGVDARARFRYLFDEPPADSDEVARWIESQNGEHDRVGFAVVDLASGRAHGRLFLMRIAPAHRRIEVGNILFGPEIARTRVATETVFLVARHCLDHLQFRRLEWKCDRLNAPSRRAAVRFGFVFEGEFRRDFIVKGRSRDTAWYSITDEDWPASRREFERWLDPANFDSDGRQRTPLNPGRRH